jgi:hypothetical protein
MFDALYELEPGFAVAVGKHQFDGRIADRSGAGLQKLAVFWHSVIDQSGAFVGLDAAQSFERDSLIQSARGQLFALEDADLPHTNPYSYYGDFDPDVYLNRDYADPTTRMKAVIAFLKAVPNTAAAVSANIHPPFSSPIQSFAVATFNGFGDHYRNDVPAAFAGVADPALQQQLSAAAQAASQAMYDLAHAFQVGAVTQSPTYALGADRFLRMLSSNEAMATSVAELQSVGEADLLRNQKALADACAQFAPGLSIAACVDQMNANVSQDGNVALAIKQIAELRAFVIAKDLLSLSDTDQIGVRSSPPQSGADFFAPVGPFDSNVPAFYYASNRKDMGEASRLFVTAHEVMPGHFVQFARANRLPTLTGQIFLSYGAAEGWAHYSEEMLWEAGLRGTAEAHIGQLAQALVRDCRLLAGLGLHAQGMSVAGAQSLFQQQCYLNANAAFGEARRGAYDPMYVTYTLGKLMIRRLREDWTATRGGKAAWKAFHDTFLGLGGPPIPLARQQMMGESTPRTLI